MGLGKRLGIGGAIVALLMGALWLGGLDFTGVESEPPAGETAYEYKSPHSRDGIGKFYLGREIAQVMGYQGAMWLERPSREAEEHTSEIVAALGLQSSDVVADLGAGTGYLTFQLAPAVPDGKVYAVDLQPEMLDVLNFIREDEGVPNVELVQASETSPNLPPASIDVAIAIDAYHEFAYPHEMMAAIAAALKPGGRVVLVEYRRENPLIPIKTLHKMSVAQARKELQAAGLEWIESQEFLPQQHFIIFRKPSV